MQPEPRYPGITTLKYKSTTRGKERDPKDKFMSLVKKLQKIAEVVENTDNLNKLSATLVNVILEAKPLIPSDKVGVLYEEEPRVLLHPRRIRPYKKKVPLDLLIFPTVVM